MRLGTIDMGLRKGEVMIGIRKTLARMLVSFVAVLAVGYSASTALAADVFVGAGGCILANGGHVTRPAGSTIVIRHGDLEVNRGVLTNFLRAQSTSVTVNGGNAIDLSNSWGEPTRQPDGTWVATVVYSTGVLLANPGDTMTFSIDVSVAHQIAQVTNGLPGFSPGPPLFAGPGTVFSGTCTVTAV